MKNKKTSLNKSYERPLKCDFCQYRARIKSQLKFHMEKHSDQKFECKICFITVLNSNLLNRHMRSMHTNKRMSHKCALCTASYGYYISLERHIEKHHFNDKNKIKFTCDICGEKFYLKNYLENHINCSHSQPFKCMHEGCTKSFSSVKIRRAHYKSMHKEKFKVSHDNDKYDGDDD